MAVDRIALSRQGAHEESPQEGIEGVHSTGSRSVQGTDCIERKSRIRSDYAMLMAGCLNPEPRVSYQYRLCAADWSFKDN